MASLANATASTSKQTADLSIKPNVAMSEIIESPNSPKAVSVGQISPKRKFKRKKRNASTFMNNNSLQTQSLNMSDNFSFTGGVGQTQLLTPLMNQGAIKLRPLEQIQEEQNSNNATLYVPVSRQENHRRVKSQVDSSSKKLKIQNNQLSEKDEEMSNREMSKIQTLDQENMKLTQIQIQNGKDMLNNKEEKPLKINSLQKQNKNKSKEEQKHLKPVIVLKKEQILNAFQSSEGTKLATMIKDQKKEYFNSIQQPLATIDENEQNQLQPIKFIKGELIGQGAYGKVYSALDMGTGQMLAIKTIELSMNQEQLQKEIKSIQNEIVTLKQLNHINIVQYFYSDINSEQNGIDLILENVPGGSIRKLLDKYVSFDERLVKIYTHQMLQGLSYLHQHGIIHRDLKCANVLVDNKGVVKLSDFGASKRIVDYNFQQKGNQTASGEINIENLSKSIKGSPYWMAPEVIKKSGHSKPADIWSLGCCVIEMLNSKPPWSEYGSDPKIIMNLIKNTRVPPKFPSNISAECKEFLELCFMQDPIKRPTANELLLHPFVFMKYQKALLDSQEAIRLFGSQSLIQSCLGNSVNSPSPNQFQQQPMNQMSANYGFSGYQNQIGNSIGSSQQSFAFNSQLNMGQFLQNHNKLQNSNNGNNLSTHQSVFTPDNKSGAQMFSKSNQLEIPHYNNLNNFNNQTSVNSINSIVIGGLGDPSVSMASVMQGSTNLRLSNNSGSGPRHLRFAENLSRAIEKQKQERQKLVIQNWIKEQINKKLIEEAQSHQDTSAKN